MKSRFIQTFVMLFVLCSSAACVADDPIEIVRQGVLEAFPTTTIGQAFDNYEGFSKATWETQTLPNGTRIVTVTAELPIENTTSDIPAAIDKGIIYIEFILNTDDTFSINGSTLTYTGADFAAVETFCREQHERWGLLAAMTENGCEKENSMLEFVLAAIYSNKPVLALAF